MTKTFLRTLREYDSDAVLPLAERSPGVYEQELMIQGNSILATVFVDGSDPGATVHVEWWDATTGKALGESFILGDHGTLTSGEISRKTITRIHNKPTFRAVVAGGNVRFSIYVTVVSSFASDLDSSLQAEGEAVSVYGDKGIPIAAYEEESGVWKFLRVINGRLQVDVPDVLVTQLPITNMTAPTTIVVGTIPVEAKAEELRLLGRRSIVLCPNGKVWHGSTSGVTPSNGIPIFKNDRAVLDVGDTPLYLVAESDVTVRIVEVK